MTTVVKIGGALLEDLDRAYQALAPSLNGSTIVVHGGGLQINRQLEASGIQPRFIDGLRVTDARTLDVVVSALLGNVHARLVAHLQRNGTPAVGLFGVLRAEPADDRLGYVGSNISADAKTLRQCLSAGLIPVIPCLAMGPESLLNVNGDDAATAVAASIRADRLTFFTDVEGVRDATGACIPFLEDPLQLLETPVVSGGMRPKLRAVARALQAGVRTVTVGKTVCGAGGTV